MRIFDQDDSNQELGFAARNISKEFWFLMNRMSEPKVLNLEAKGKVFMTMQEENGKIQLLITNASARLIKEKDEKDTCSILSPSNTPLHLH